MLDLSLPKLLILAMLALVIFGPQELPTIAARAGRALRELRRIAEGATAELHEGLGPEFSSFDIDDLNPRKFVHKHLFSDMNEPGTGESDTRSTGHIHGTAPGNNLLLDGESPFDTEAT